MFRSNTLLLLGAGASKPYEYSLGDELIRHIMEDMNDIVFIPIYTESNAPLFGNNNDQNHNYYYEYEFLKDNFGVLGTSDNLSSLASLYRDNFSDNLTMYDERLTDLSGSANKTDYYRNKLSQANEIIIIGFGFDRDNLTQIGFPNTVDEYKKLFSNKIIRYLNYTGYNGSIDNDFSDLKKNISSLKVLRSDAGLIKHAYMNDFKGYLFK